MQGNSDQHLLKAVWLLPLIAGRGISGGQSVAQEKGTLEKTARPKDNLFYPVRVDLALRAVGKNCMCIAEGKIQTFLFFYSVQIKTRTQST